MFPKGMTEEQAQKAYAEIVAAVRAHYSAKDKGTYTYADVKADIAKHWHEACGVPYKPEEPAVPTGPPTAPGQLEKIKTPIAPDAGDEELSPIKRGKPRKMKRGDD